MESVEAPQGPVFDIELVKDKLAKLSGVDSRLSDIIIARAALRVFPMLAAEGDFFFLNDTESGLYAKVRIKTAAEETDTSSTPPDNRFSCILAVFGLLKQPLLPELPETEAEQLLHTCDALMSAARGISSFNNNRPALATFRGLASAVNSLSFTIGKEPEKALRPDFHGLNDFSEMLVQVLQEGELNLFTNELNSDFTQAADGGEVIAEHLAEKPLWREKRPGLIDKIWSEHFVNSWKLLSKELIFSRPQHVEVLQQLIDEYEILLRGVQPAETKFSPRHTTVPEEANSDKDSLNRSNLVNGLAGIFCDDGHQHPLTVGLMGNWGSGKTKVLELLKAALRERGCEQPFLFGEFNAWAYEHARNIQAAMAHEVISALTACDTLTPVDESAPFSKRLRQSLRNNLRLAKWKSTGRLRIIYGFAVIRHADKLMFATLWASILLLSVDWLYSRGFFKAEVDEALAPGNLLVVFASIGSLWKLSKQIRDIIAQPMTQKFLTYLRLPDYASHIGEISQMQQDIKTLTALRLGYLGEDCHDFLIRRTQKRRLLFIVDDLDRCSPEGIVKTFEAVRLVLNIPQVTVIIAVDHRIALAALALHYKDIEPYHTLQDARAIARDYLAKMIQVPIVLSDGDNKSIQSYLTDMWQYDATDSWIALLPEGEEEASSIMVRDNHQSKGVEQPEARPQDEQSHQSERLSDDDVAALMISTQLQGSHDAEVTVGLQPEQKAAMFFWATDNQKY